MRVIKEINKISEELKAKIVPLKPGETAIYQIREFNITEDPDTREKKLYYTKREIYLKDTVWDNAQQKSVDIGIPDTIDKGEIVTYKLFQFHNPFDGCIHLYGNKIEDRETHEFLQLSNHCEQSVLGEDRNVNAEIIYRLIDRTKEAKVKNKKRTQKKDALVFLDSMDAQDMREFAASMNWNHNAPIEELSAQIGDYAEMFTADFVKAMESTETKRKATIKYALDENIISYDPSGHKIVWGNGSGVIASLERMEGKNHIEIFNLWLATSANGEKILGQLRKKTAKEAVTA